MRAYQYKKSTYEDFKGLLALATKVRNMPNSQVHHIILAKKPVEDKKSVFMNSSLRDDTWDNNYPD